MATAKDHVICHVCGFKNALDVERCVSCGAKVEALSASDTDDAGSRGFSVKWAVIAFVVYLALQGIALAGLPAVLSAYDPQGFSALMASMVVWGIGGVLIGFVSPGRTLVEPAVGALLALIPTVWWIVHTTPTGPEHLSGGFQLNMPAYVIGGLMGGMVSLFGAFGGERLQKLKDQRGSGAKR
jgi:hypothetical protein